MKKVIRWTFFTLLILLLIIGGSLYVVLNTTFVSKHIVRRIVEENFKDHQIKSLTITQKFISPNTLVIERLELVLNSKIHPSAKPFVLKADRLAIILASFDNIDITARRIDFESDKIRAADLSFEALAAVDRGKFSNIQGSLRLKELEIKPIKISRVASIFKGDDKSLRFSNLTSDAYQGRLAGEVSLEYQPPLSYSIALNVQNMNFQSLEELNAAVFSQFEGELNGHITIAADQNKIKTIETDFFMPHGGKAKASLVAYFLQYGLPPGTQERELLDYLLSTDGKIPAEELSLEFKNVSAKKISGKYKFYSKQLNVDLNNTVDFNLDTELVSLAQAVVQIQAGLMALINPHLKKEEL